MRDCVLVGVARAIAALGAALGLGGLGTMVGVGQVEEWAVYMVLPAVFFAAFVWVVVPTQPRNPVVWAMSVSAACAGIWALGLATTLVIVGDPGLLVTDFVPTELPRTAAWVMAGTAWAWIGAFAPVLTIGLLLFPDGRLPGSGWRWVVHLAVISTLGGVAAGFWTTRPGYDGVPFTGGLSELSFLGVTVAAVLSLAALVTRFARSTGQLRQQFKWVVWGASIFVPAFVVTSSVEGSRYDVPAVVAAFLVAEAVFLGAYGIAVGRFRLYDVDVVISRTVVYGTLAVFIATVYVGTVVGIGQLLGSGPEPNPGLAITATAGVAVAVQPVRRHVQRAANRLVYGRRATPYEVLSDFSRRVAVTDDALLDQVSRSLVEGTGATRAAVWVTVDGDLVRAAEWPDVPAAREEEVTAFPIMRDGVLLGRLMLSVAPGQHVSEDDRRLADEVAAGLGLTLRNRRLTGVLRARIDELRESRRRLVVVQDDTRRRLERDLHDGAQQQLVALKVKLGLARGIAVKDGATRTGALLEELGGEADLTIDTVRDFARGVYPPLLEAEGLASAVTAYLRRSPVPTTLQADGVDRCDRQAEATVYFCIVEALQNVARHAAATAAHVRLDGQDRVLAFEVVDDGIGFDPVHTPRGGGLTTINDRLDAAGGELAIRSARGRGTVLRGIVPREGQP